MINSFNLNSYLPNRDRALQGAVEGAICLVAGAVNTGTALPTKYYFTNQFASSGMRVLQERGIVQIAPPEVSARITTIYLALLFLVGKGLLGDTQLNNEYLLALLSSPTAVNAITGSASFQSVLRAIRRKERGVANRLMLEIAKEYYQGKSFPAKTGGSSRIENQAISSVVSTLSNEVEKRKEKTTNSFEQVSELIENLNTDGEWEELGLAVIQFASRVKLNWVGVSTFSPMSMICGAYFGSSRGKIVAPPFHERILNAYYLSNELGLSNAAPALFISGNPGLPEMALRTAGVAFAVFSDQPFISTVVTECALKLVPRAIEKSSFNQQVLAVTERNRAYAMRQLNTVVGKFEQTMGARGWDVDQVKKGVLQSLCGVTYSLLKGNNSAFMIALNSEYFCTYTAALAANHGVVRPELLLAEVGMTALPYKLLVGMFFTANEWAGSGYGSTLLCVAASLPMVVDVVASNRQYQKGLRRVTENYVPYFRSLLRIKNTCLLAVESMNLAAAALPGRAPAIIRVTQAVIGSTVVVSVRQAVQSALENPYVQQTMDAFRVGGGWIASKVTKIHAVGLASRFVGSSLGSLAALADKPMNRRTVALGVVAAGVGYFSESPALTTLAVEAISTGLSSAP